MHLAKIALALFLTTALIGCNKKTDDTPAPIIRPVKLYQVDDQTQTNLRSFPAEVEANQGSYLGFRVNGELKSFAVLAGQHVEKGQLLAQLDPTDFKLQVEDKKARFELAQSQLERTQSLLGKGITTESEFDQAKANKQVAESAYKKALTDLDYTELRAPFSGTVSKVFVKNFENIQAKQNILRLETRDLMDVTIQVPEKVVARVNKNINYQPKVVFDGFSEQAYSLTVKEWDTQADPNTLTYRVVFSLPVPNDFNLLAGMTGNVLIDLTQITKTSPDQFMVPVEAVFSQLAEDKQTYQHFVWRYNEQDHTVSKVAVTIGELHQVGIEVLSGLKAGDFIVSAGVHSLSDNLVVRPWQREKGL